METEQIKEQFAQIEMEIQYISKTHDEFAVFLNTKKIKRLFRKDENEEITKILHDYQNNVIRRTLYTLFIELERVANRMIILTEYELSVPFMYMNLRTALRDLNEFKQQMERYIEYFMYEKSKAFLESALEGINSYFTKFKLSLENTYTSTLIHSKTIMGE